MSDRKLKADILRDVQTLYANRLSSGTGGSGITALTGDVTASGTGSVVATIASGAVSTTELGGDITTAGKALLDDADNAAQRTTLGLGTAATQNTGAFEASGAVATHAALTSGVHGITAFGAQLVDDIDAATARTTLGLGTAATTATTAYEAAGSIATHNAITTAHGISSFGASLVDDLSDSAARTTLGLGTLATQSGTFSGTSSGTNTGDQNTFSTIAVSGQGDVVADTASDTLTLVAGANVTITTNPGSDSVTINASSGAGANTLYAPGSFTVATGNFALHCKRLQLTTTQRMTLSGTARFRLSN